MISLKKTKKAKIIRIVILAVFISVLGVGYAINFDLNLLRRIKVYSNDEVIKSISYRNLKEKAEKTNEKIGKIDSLTHLLSILYSMNCFPEYNYFNSSKDILEESGIYSDGAGISAMSNDYSETNTQVSGVDEADIIKNDGNFIYYLNDGTLNIFDTSAELPVLVSKTKIDDNNQMFYSIYILDNNLILRGGKYVNFNNSLDSSTSYGDYSFIPDEIKYNSFTVFAVYDISNRKEPFLKRTIEIEGHEISSRLVGENLYFATNKSISYFPDNKINNYEILPMYKDTAISSDLKIIKPSDISYFSDSLNANYLLIGAFNITKNEEVVLQAYLGSGSEIYMNSNSLYISREIDQPISSQSSNTSEAIALSRNTEIYRFQIDDIKIKYIGTASIEGILINQYSMDEYKGILRVASQCYTNGNGITTIDINTMIPVASISGLAIDERIYAVRFMGDVGYMVTYRNVDPLFVFDLSNPEKPIKTGELKIPGFSQYLHPVGDNYLVGFGKHTEEEYYFDKYGKKVTTRVHDLGFKLSLFDVSDMYHPKEVFVQTYSEDSFSSAIYDPLTIMVDAKKNIFAFPFKDNSDSIQSGTVVKIDPLLGFTTLADTTSKSSYLYTTRFCYIKNKLFTITENNIAVYSYPECEFIDNVMF